MVVEGDVVLVNVEGKPAFFARVEAITPDFKPEWYQVRLLVLQIPLMVITWILRRAYIDGIEFTMGGRPVQVAKVVAPEEETLEENVEGLTEESPPEPANETPEPPGKGKVVSLMDRRKKDHSS
jgi:hypothetical protein